MVSGYYIGSADIGHFQHYQKFHLIAGLESNKEEYLHGAMDSKQFKKSTFIIGEGFEWVQCACMEDVTNLTFRRK